MRVPTRVLIGVIVAAGGVALYCLYRGLGIHFGWPPPRIELGNLSEALGALFTVLAVGAALWIASSDRRDRARERHEQELTQARLVLVTVSPVSHPSASIEVEVRNFGPLPILDIELAGASWTEHPTARLAVSFGQYIGVVRPATARRRPVLMSTNEFERSATTVVDFILRFKDEFDDDRPLTEPTARTAGYQHPNYEPIDLANVVVKVRFTTADGVRWETPTEGGSAGEPVRVSRSAKQ